MLKHAELTRYRGFEHYKLANLGPVNLLVGKNNSGKTSLLEGIHFLTAGGDPLVLAQVTARRGEFVAVAEDEPPYNDFSHFFYQHEIREGSSFNIRSDNGIPEISVTVMTSDDPDLFGEYFDRDEMLRPTLALRVERHGTSSEQNPLFLSDRGAVLAYGKRSGRRFPVPKNRDGPPIVFISPDSLSPLSLAAMWRQILYDRQEKEVIAALQILEENLEDIVFEPVDNTRHYPPYIGSSERGGVLISLRNDRRRIPLGSMGDGMRRLLVLAISLIQAKNGFLLIDEIDTGFHYSIMDKMWELVIKTAQGSGTQVFATTHSWDCIVGLSQICEAQKNLLPEVTIQTIDRTLPESISFTGDSITRLVQHEIDPR